MSSNNNTAVVLTEVGKPLSLDTSRPIPEPTEGQIQVKVSVVGINPHDGKSRDVGIFVTGKLPAVLGADVVGTVIKVGAGVSNFSIGDRVVYQPSFFIPTWTQHGLQEYAVADAWAAAKIPSSITDDQAATLPTNVIAPLVSLFSLLKIPAPWSPAAKDFDYANTSLLIIGGGSSSGKFGVQLAKIAGIGRIVVVGGKEVELKKFGATHVLDRHADYDTLLANIRSIVGDDLIYAYDSVSNLNGQLLPLNALSNTKKGGLARLLPLGPVDKSKVIGKEAGYDVHDVFGSSHAHQEVAKGLWANLTQYLENGQITPLGYVVKQGLKPEHVNEIMDAYRDGKPATKTHIHI